MRLNSVHELRLTTTDLTTYTACEHASRLEIDRALGRTPPDCGSDPDAGLLAELGRRHEAVYLEHLRAQGLRVEWLEPFVPGAEARVFELMRAGVDIIAQAPLRHGDWVGVADVLRGRRGWGGVGHEACVTGRPSLVPECVRPPRCRL